MPDDRQPRLQPCSVCDHPVPVVNGVFADHFLDRFGEACMLDTEQPPEGWRLCAGGNRPADRQDDLPPGDVAHLSPPYPRHAGWCVNLAGEPWCDCGYHDQKLRAEGEKAATERIERDVRVVLDHFDVGSTVGLAILDAIARPFPSSTEGELR